MNISNHAELPKSFAAFILYFMRKQWRGFLLLQITCLAWSLDNTLWPYAFKLLIDKITTFNQDKSMIWVSLMPVLLLWGGLWLVMVTMFRSEGIIGARIIPYFEANIRLHMFDYVKRHSYDYFANNLAGNLSNKIADMTASATRVLQIIMVILIPAFVSLIIAATLFFTVGPYFAVILLVWLLIHTCICVGSANYLSQLSNKHADTRSLLSGKIVDIFSNILNVKIFAREAAEIQYVKRFQAKERQQHYRSVIEIEKIRIVLDVFGFIFPFVLMTGYQIYAWQHNQIGVGDIVFLFNATWNIMTIAWISGMELPNLYKEIGVCQQALQIIQQPHGISETRSAKPMKIEQGNIVFENVNFRYDQHKLVFENLNLTIKAGTKVGLVGFSGSGKTTFVNLLMRFFDIHAGTIKIDGHNIADTTLDSLRSQISLIPQNPTLFHRTLRENIAYGKPDALGDEIISAAQHAHCAEFIDHIPNGYDALVGERGIKLSGGQRQRVAIARAILENAPILILDEATSALDSVTEKHIQDALDYLMAGRTTLVIAHRLSTLAQMDRILVFDQGKIIEDGTHKALLKAEGHYAKLWRMQAGGFLFDQLDE